MTDARIGWGGEVWLSTNLTEGALVELVEVKSFALPDDEVEDVQATHLKSPDRRHEYVAGMQEGGEVEVVLNYIPGSATDLLINAAKAAGTTRYIRFLIPSEAGVPEWQVDTFAYVKGYARGPVSPDAVIEATVRFKITGDVTEEAAAT